MRTPNCAYVKSGPLKRIAIGHGNNVWIRSTRTLVLNMVYRLVNFFLCRPESVFNQKTKMSSRQFFRSLSCSRAFRTMLEAVFLCRVRKGVQFLQTQSCLRLLFFFYCIFRNTLKSLMRGGGIGSTSTLNLFQQ